MLRTTQAVRRPLLIISALIATLGAFTIGTQLASAHHAHLVGANVNCAGTVSYTAVAWEGQGEGQDLINSRTNDLVVVTYRINDAGPDVFVRNGAFNQANGFQFSGSFAWPASNPASITIYATPQVPWANGNPGGEFDSATVNRPTDCANPSASATVQCSANDGTVVVTLTNGDTFAPAAFTVGSPTGGASQVVTVPAGGTATVTFTGVPDGSRSVSITSGGEDLSLDFVVNCDAPATTTTTVPSPTTSVASEPPVPSTSVASGGPVTTVRVASLPATGSSTMTGVLIGTALVALGGVAALAARRRRPA